MTAQPQMKLPLNAGDWATFAFFALAVTLGCYAELQRPLPARGAATTATANHSSSSKTVVAAVGRE